MVGMMRIDPSVSFFLETKENLRLTRRDSWRHLINNPGLNPTANPK